MFHGTLRSHIRFGGLDAVVLVGVGTGLWLALFPLPDQLLLCAGSSCLLSGLLPGVLSNVCGSHLLSSADSGAAICHAQGGAPFANGGAAPGYQQTQGDRNALAWRKICGGQGRSL